MKPTCEEIIEAVVENIRTLLRPVADTPHAASAAENSIMLLEHVLLRLKNDNDDLLADVRQKRDLFAELADRIADSEARTRVTFEPLLEAYTAIESFSGYASVKELASESSELAELLDEWIRKVWRERDLLGPDLHRDCRASIRSHLRDQLDRDAKLLAPIDGARIYAF